jgi:hypothetical protein
MIPNPVMRKPGSMPRILRAGPAIAPHYTFECAARAPLRRLLIDHRGRVDVLRVVEASRASSSFCIYDATGFMEISARMWEA